LKRLDILITVIVLAIGAAGYLIYGYSSGGADTGQAQPMEADIYIGSELIDTLSLDTDRDLEVERGDAYNLVRVGDGVIRVAEANCPDKTCVHTGAKGRAGEMIVCLPNRLQIKIRGGDGKENESGVDAVSG
jgi:hypothetical protein